MNTNPSETAEKPNSLQDNFIFQAWLVLLLATLFGLSLAGVQLKLGPTIEENKINETRERVPELVLDASQLKRLSQENTSLVVTPHSVGIQKERKKIFYTVFSAKYPDGRLAGWVAKTKGQGYADKIELLVGLDPPAKTITGIYILEQKETPGLGNKIITEKWRGQFVHKGVDTPLEVVKTGARAANDIDAVTGATISSKSVCDIINKTVGDLKEPLAAGQI